MADLLEILLCEATEEDGIFLSKYDSIKKSIFLYVNRNYPMYGDFDFLNDYNLYIKKIGDKHSVIFRNKKDTREYVEHSGYTKNNDWDNGLLKVVRDKVINDILI